MGTGRAYNQSAAEEYELPDVGAGPSTTHPQTYAQDRWSPQASSSNWHDSRQSPKTEGHPSKSGSGKRTITFHGNSSVIFSTGQEGIDGGSPVHGHTRDLPGSPFRQRRRAYTGGTTTTPVLPPALHLPSNINHHDLFLSDEAIQADGMGHGPTQTVEMPDFGGLLGLNAEGEDNYLIVRGMKQDWKRKLFLLMEEPGSGKDAFAVHVLSTTAILFR